MKKIKDVYINNFWKSVLSAFIILLLISSQLKATTYTSIANGDWTSGSTWQGGNVPPSGTIGSNKTINIKHIIDYPQDNLVNNGTINIIPAGGSTATLNIPDGYNFENYGDLNITGGSLINYRFSGGGDSGSSQSGNFINKGGNVTIENGYAEYAQNWQSEEENQGIVEIINSCVIVGESFQVKSDDIYTGANISLGWHGSGNFQFNSGNITFTDVRFQLAGTSGDFQLSSGTSTGSIDYITLKNHDTGNTGSGKIEKTNSGSVTLDDYCGSIAPTGFSGSKTLDCSLNYFPANCTPGGGLTGPTAVNDNTTTPMNTPVDIIELANDIVGDAALDPTSVSFVTGTEPNPGTEGTFSVNATTGLVTFTPINGFVGTVTIDYNVCDLNSLCDIATIVVVITPITGPTAVDDNATTPFDTPVDITELANDIVGDAALDPTSVSFVGGTEPNPATEGLFTVNATSGLVTFTPVSGFSGTVTIDYEVCDLNSLCDIATITVIISPGSDTDGDGVPDVNDDYPNDPDRAFNNYYPAGGNGTLAYEDLWPGQGDYDFNDLIIDYRFMTVTSASNHIVETFGTFIVKAFGASLENGFGFQLANSNIADVDIISVTGYDLQEGYINLEANGIEEGQSIPTIIVYDNAFNILTHPGSGIGVNTTPGAPYVEPDTLNMFMSYTQGTYTLAELDIPNFNPFLIVDLNRSIEVHLPDYEPTDKADQSFFGTINDDSNPGTGKYYKTVNNLPWAIHITEPFEYPTEKSDITSVYLKFTEWAESGGQLYQDWYRDEPGYRNSSLIYTHN